MVICRCMRGIALIVQTLVGQIVWTFVHNAGRRVHFVLLVREAGTGRAVSGLVWIRGLPLLAVQEFRATSGRSARYIFQRGGRTRRVDGVKGAGRARHRTGEAGLRQRRLRRRVTLTLAAQLLAVLVEVRHLERFRNFVRFRFLLRWDSDWRRGQLRLGKIQPLVGMVALVGHAEVRRKRRPPGLR